MTEWFHAERDYDPPPFARDYPPLDIPALRAMPPVTRAAAIRAIVAERNPHLTPGCFEFSRLYTLLTGVIDRYKE